jgi:flagellar hook assembly protein FlgD
VVERVLKVVVQPRPEGGLSVSSVHAAQTGQGVMLSYALSTEAAVDVRVRNIAGLVVSEVALDRLSPAGQNTLLWNGRSKRGNLVPSGRYLCEITARSPLTGQSLSVVQPLSLQR